MGRLAARCSGWVPPATARAGWSYDALDTFNAIPNGVRVDAAGNVFGTTLRGGRFGAGIAFALRP